MTRRKLPGIVVAMPDPQQPMERREAVIAAAVAYVAAQRAWDARVDFAPKERQVMHLAWRELAAAVDGMQGQHALNGEIDQK